MGSFQYKDPVECSRVGDVEYFKTVELDFLQRYRMHGHEDTCLSIAASDGQLECCEEIYRRCPSHLYCPNFHGNTIFHHVSYYGSGFTSLLKFFLDKGATAEAQEADLERGQQFANLLQTLNHAGETALCRGLHNRNLETTKLWIKADKDYNLKLLQICNNDKDTPLHLAVKYQDYGLVELLVAAADPDFEYSPNKDGETPLWIAMRMALSPGNTSENNTAVNIRKFLLDKQPLHATVRAGEKKWTSLQQAAHIGDVGSIEDIIRACPTCMELVDDEGKNFLHIAVKFGQLKMVELVLRRHRIDESILNQIDKYGYSPWKIANNEKNTLLHLAVVQRDLELVDQLTCAVPDAVYGTNKDGETPLLIAMRQALSSENSSDQITSVKIRKLLLEKLPSQSLACTGEKKWTALHHAAHIGDVGAIEDIIKFSPNCMNVVDTEGRNFLHVAVKFEQYLVLKKLLESNDLADNILNHRDNYGNTPLHIAAETGNQNLVLCLLYHDKVDKRTINARGQKVLDAITFDYDKEKAGVHWVRDRMNDKELKDQSDFDLVVGALIATVSFTAGITVPGGYISDGPNSGMALLVKRASFEAFAISNNFALVFSLYAVFSHFCTRRLLNREDIIYQLNVATFCTLGAIFAMMVAFITGSYSVLANSNRIAITVCVNSCCFFIFAFRALLRMVRQHKLAAPWNYRAFS